MSGAFLDGLRVVDLGDNTGRRACRALADLGAEVVRVDLEASSSDVEPAGEWERIWDCGQTVRSSGSGSALQEFALDANVIVASLGTVRSITGSSTDPTLEPTASITRDARKAEPDRRD